MIEQGDPFSGIWRFNPHLSKLSTAFPQSWLQEISAGPDEISVQETIVRLDGTKTFLGVQAKFDGRDDTVEGSPLVETIAYRRIDRNTISGTGKKQGMVSLTETVTVSRDPGTLTLTYSVHHGSKVVADGVAVFEIA
jgi:hypothetical protein